MWRNPEGILGGLSTTRATVEVPRRTINFKPTPGFAFFDRPGFTRRSGTQQIFQPAHASNNAIVPRGPNGRRQGINTTKCDISHRIAHDSHLVALSAGGDDNSRQYGLTEAQSHLSVAQHAGFYVYMVVQRLSTLDQHRMLVAHDVCGVWIPIAPVPLVSTQPIRVESLHHFEVP